MIRQLFVLVSIVLYFALLLWKAAAAVMGWSWRRKWVRIVDAAGFAALAGGYAVLQIVWQGAVHGGSEGDLLVAAGVWVALVLLLTLAAYAIDGARRNIR